MRLTEAPALCTMSSVAFGSVNVPDQTRLPSSSSLSAGDQAKPLPSRRFSRGLSLALIVLGLALLGAGIYSPLKDRLDLLKYAPPTAFPPAESEEPADVIASAPPTSTATPTPTIFPTASPTAAPILLPTVTPAPTFTPTPNPYPPANSAPARIVAESIKLDSEVIEVGWHQETVNGQSVSVWDVPDYVVGWHKNSARPGHVGNIVLSGHHNVVGEVFRYVVDLEPGAEITLYADGLPYRYAVEDKFILKDKDEPDEVRKQNARWIGPFNDQRLTLITCWPYSNNTHRVVVIAKPIL